MISRTSNHVKRIIVIALDWDGCLFHGRYLESHQPNKLIECNLELLHFLTSKIIEEKYDQVILMVASNRQSQRINEAGEKECCYAGTLKIRDALQALLDKHHEKIICTVDEYLLSDTSPHHALHDLEPGSNFKNAVAKNKSFQYRDFVYDESKVALTATQMHKISHENPDCFIAYDFYDDRMDILRGLDKLYHEYPFFFPKRTQFRSYQYDENGVKAITDPIMGKGEFIGSFQEYFRLMLTCLDNSISCGTPYHFGIRFMMQGKISHFQNWCEIRAHLYRLQQEINHLDLINTNHSSVHSSAFLIALRNLANYIESDIEQQRKKFIPPSYILQSEAVQIAKQTSILLQSLDENHDNKIVDDYVQICRNLQIKQQFLTDPMKLLLVAASFWPGKFAGDLFNSGIGYAMGTLSSALTAFGLFFMRPSIIKHVENVAKKGMEWKETHTLRPLKQGIY